MNLSEMVAEIGDDNIGVQNVLNCADSIKKTKHGVKITFYTDAISDADLMALVHGGKTEKVGLIVWMPRDKVDAMMAKAKG